MDPKTLREQAGWWRELAVIGEQSLRETRLKWAASLEQMATEKEVAGPQAAPSRRTA
jgi:hypothetical protein